MKNRDKPFVEMNPQEYEDAWDGIGREVNDSLLQTARIEGGMSLVIALAVLRRADGSSGVAHSQLEYGDGEGIRGINEFIRQVRRTKALQQGEQLELVMCTVDVSEQVEGQQ